MLARTLIGAAVLVAFGVAAVGGVRSFEAVSAQFGSVLVPLTADGMIIACTALRLAALTRGWRLPGSLLVTYNFIAGTVALNVAAAHGWAEVIAHALAPVSYAVLVEMLSHLLRQHLRLTQPARPRLDALTWVTSPVITTRVWLHLARTGGDDPTAARALVQQVVRMASRLRTVCPGRCPLGRAATARAAALQTIRDGLLTAPALAGLLPDDDRPLRPGALLALVDQAALQRAAPAPPARTDPGPPGRTDPGAPVRTGPAPPLRQPDGDPAHRDRTDADLVAELRRHGGPLSGRQVMRILGVGTPKATRLIRLAGWAPADPPASDPVDPTDAAAGSGPTHQRPHLIRTDEASASTSTGTDR